MRRIGLAIIVVWAALALAAAGTRGLGHLRAAEAFPLPSEDRCWQGLCFLEIRREAAADALNTLPDVLPGSAHDLRDTRISGEYIVLFRYAPGGTGYIPVLFYWNAHSYNLMSNWLRRGSPALMTLGDVLVQAGPPEEVGLVAGEIELDYPARGLSIMVVPAGFGPDWARVTAASPVTVLFVVGPDLAISRERTYSPPSRAWQGFGVYWFPD
jgi:hypothetical protein